MQIVTSHKNTDFDGLASIVACTCLYPGAVGVLPSSVTAGVKAFMAIHGDLFRVRSRKGFDLEGIDSLIVVDTNRWQQLDNMKALETRKGLEVIVWDHHVAGVTIDSATTFREEIGATTTLLVEELQRRDTPMTPMQATLFLLGIYDDTGSLRFSSATPRDAKMTAFLLENGADLNIVSSYLSDTIDDSHTRVFSDMLDKSRIHDIKGMSVGISAMPVLSGLTMLASLVEKFKEFKGLDAAIGIFLTDNDKAMVIGRSNPSSLDVGAVVRALGGGGHPAAGAAVVKGADLDSLTEQVAALIVTAGQSDIRVRDIMSAPDRFVIAPDTLLSEAGDRMDTAGINGLLVAEGERFFGVLGRGAVDKALANNRLETPAKGSVKPHVPKVGPEDMARTAMEEMNNSAEGLIPVMERDRLVGVLTRGNLILHIYDI